MYQVLLFKFGRHLCKGSIGNLKCLIHRVRNLVPRVSLLCLQWRQRRETLGTRLIVSAGWRSRNTAVKNVSHFNCSSQFRYQRSQKLLFLGLKIAQWRRRQRLPLWQISFKVLMTACSLSSSTLDCINSSIILCAHHRDSQTTRNCLHRTRDAKERAC